MIETHDLTKTYDLGARTVQALDSVAVRIDKGEFVTIMGPSGSGKSTLLHILGILDQPSSGEYLLEGHNVIALRDREQSRIRNQHFGFVFQSFNLFPEYTALENVMMPLVYAGKSFRESRNRAADLLGSVEMGTRASHYPNMLSGGEQQRVAIARALSNGPDVIFADEPTGNLPSTMGRAVLRILYSLNDSGKTVVMVTHDEQLGRCGKRCIRLADGRIVSDQRTKVRFDPSADEAAS